MSSADTAASDICSAEATDGTSPGVSVGCVNPLVAGGGEGKPQGISPASAVDERTHARAAVITSRFTGFLLRKCDARFLTSGGIEHLSEKCCKGLLRSTRIPLGCKFSYTHVERYISHEDNLTKGTNVPPYS